MAYCTKCGKELRPNASFCTGCGAQVRSGGAGGAYRAAPADGGMFRDMFNRIDAAVTGFSDNFSRVTDEVERLTSREKPGAYCLKNCLAEGEACAACIKLQAALERDIAALRGQEQRAAPYGEPVSQEEAGNMALATTQAPAEEAAQDPAGQDAAGEAFAAMNDDEREVLLEATVVCNDMIDLLANAKLMTEAQAKRITEDGGTLALSISRMGDAPRGYKYYTAMTDEQLFQAAWEFKLHYADYISRLPTGDTCTWAALEAEGRIGKAVVIGAAIVGALAIAGAAAPKGGGLSQTLKENQERTRASNAEIARLRRHSMDVDRQARESNRVVDRSLHETFMQQKKDIARADNTIRNREILRGDLRRASDSYKTESGYRRDIDNALNKFAEEERENND